MTGSFAVEVHSPHHTGGLVLVGELDHAAVAELESAVRRAGGTYGSPNVVIDIQALEFCDSAGWHALERCRADGATVVGSPPCVRRLLYLMRHAHLLPPELHELRGLERVPDQQADWETRKAA